jgi:curli production assembly/transport component CsgE
MYCSWFARPNASRFSLRRLGAVCGLVYLLCLLNAGGVGTPALAQVGEQLEQRSPAQTADTRSIATAERWGGTLQAQIRWRRQVAFDSSSTDVSDAGVQVGGLVVDETRTTIGRDFYSMFYTRWQTPDEVQNVTVRVREQPRPNLGTRLLVDVQGTTVFQATLQPDTRMIRRAARAARARTTRYLKKRYEPRDTY